MDYEYEYGYDYTPKYDTQDYDYAGKLRRLVRHFEYDANAKSMVEKAFMFAIIAHEDVKRKSGEPYVTHPIAVALNLEEKCADYETICAALLHDTIEDCKWITKEIIAQNFGETIANLVDGVTKVGIKESKDNKSIQTIKTQNKIAISLEEDVRVVEIKLADRDHNMSTISGHPSLKKRKEIAKETVDVYIPIARHLGQFNDKERLQRMCFPILHPKKAEEINEIKRELIDENIELRTLIFDLQYPGSKRSIKKYLEANEVTVHDVEFKFKEPYSIYKQLENGKRFDEINDLMTFIIKTDQIEDAYKAMQLINLKSVPQNNAEYSIRDFMAHPKHPFFRAIHTYNVIEDNGKKYLFHFQIQTIEMWRESVNGIASKWNFQTDDSAAAAMKKSLEEDFPFYDDLKRLIDDYKKHECSDFEFREKLGHLILPRQIIIRMPGFTQEQTYEGCSIKDFIIRLSKKGILSKISPNQEYYVNGIKKNLLYKLKDNDYFEIRIRENENIYSNNKEEKSFQRKRK